MEKFVIRESGPLRGRVRVSGSKNSVLPIIAATLLTDEECMIHDVPALTDVMIMQELIEDMGGKTSLNEETLKIKVQNIAKIQADYELCSKMRASFLVAGPVLARMGEVKISMPGGCAIGS
ncbi:MAG: UDP-N-acetylglucosamine 1-carboxyvinyltransferase, partial [Defluviitaleaceae bacterium]|nr:UDP-N-acetylglucosamine 1-carboxyvinyltransferase [Defluviitaleaceae bacterium]